MNTQSIKQTEDILKSNLKTLSKDKLLSILESVTEYSYPCNSPKEFDNYKKGYNDVVTFIKNGTVTWRTTTTTDSKNTWTDYQEGVVAAVNMSYGDL